MNAVNNYESFYNLDIIYFNNLNFKIIKEVFYSNSKISLNKYIKYEKK